MTPSNPRIAARYLLPVIAGVLLIAPVTARATCDPMALFGTPVTWATGPSPAYIVSRDFNADSIPDLAVTNTDFQNGGVNNSVAVLIGLGGLNYANPVLYPVGLNPHMVTAADFNEDGITDLVTANKWSSSVSILLGKGGGGVGDGTFAPAVSFPTGGYPFQIVVEDFDRDSIADLAVSLNNQYKVALLRGNGSGGVGNGTFGPPALLSLSYYSTGLEEGDFNNDGITDLVATENAAGTIAVFLGTGSTTFGPGLFLPADHIAAGPLPFEFAVGDYNEDGKLDLAIAEQTVPGGTRIMLGNGNGAFSYATTLPTGNTVGVAPDDIDQDGITDLAIGSITGGNGGATQIFLGQGANGVGNGTFAAAQSHTGLGDTYQLVPGDFDNDGRRDLVVSYYLTTYIAVFPGLCDGGPPPPPPLDPRYPILSDVRDVPHDDGGRVFLTWSKSSLDSTGGPVNAYRVWRRIPPEMMSARNAAGVPRSAWLARSTGGAGTALEYWEALVTLPAQRLPGYGYTAPTTQDSIAGSNPYTAFFVTALTSDIDVFYSSNVDSGYSVDNNAPPEPASFTAQNQGGHVSLAWEASAAVDFGEFRLYRGGEPGFVPGPGNLVVTGTETGFVDSHPSAPGSWYKLVALDIHGNQSPFALANPTGPTGVEGPSGHRLTLREPVPNPGDGRSMSVEFSLRDAGRARLEVIDVAGRVVFAREVGALGAGAHRIDVAGAGAFRAGLYFIRLTQGAEKRLTRAAVIR